METIHPEQAREILNSVGMANNHEAAHEFGTLILRAAQVLREIERAEKRKRIEAQIALHVESGR